uniref:Uncharacterized protein n=1 Tax=Rhizophora mucronata TaxID=61149 RepID=A0A2P2P9W0_RHIMU
MKRNRSTGTISSKYFVQTKVQDLYILTARPYLPLSSSTCYHPTLK